MFVVLEQVLEHLDVRRHLLPRSLLARLFVNVLGDELVSATGSAVDDNLSTANAGDHLERLHERLLHVCRPDGRVHVAPLLLLPLEVLCVRLPVCESRQG